MDSKVEEYITKVEKELEYPHWDDNQKYIFKLCLKWFKRIFEVDNEN